MSTITLPNIRVSSDLTVKLKLKDGGVALDWSTLQNIKVSIYSDAQRALAGRCGASIDAEDPTLLVCTYAANKPQYVGVNRVVVSAKYMGETKTYDKPAFNFVRWTDDQAGEQITIEDPDIDVEISVEDVSSSILQEAVDAAFTAADRANDAAEAAEHMVDIHTGPQGEKGDKGDTGEKGDTGDAAGFGTVSAALQEDGGDPSVVVAASGPDTAKQFDFTFKNLKGDKGDKGDQGNSGYQGAAGELEVVNNLTDGGSTAALSAEMGKTLEGEVSQLEAKVTEIEGGLLTIDLSGITESTGVISNQKWAAVGNSTYKHGYLQVTPGESYKVVAGGNGAATIAAVKQQDATPTIGDTPLFGDACGAISVSTNGTIYITIPGGCNYLYYTTLAGGSDRTPAIYKVVSGEISKARSEKVGYNSPFYSGVLFEYPGAISNGKWAATTGTTYKHVFIPVNPGQIVDIHAQVGNSTSYVPLTTLETSPTDGATPSYCNGYSGNVSISANTSSKVTIPQDAAWLYVSTKSGGVDVTPDIYFVAQGSVDVEMKLLEAAIVEQSAKKTPQFVAFDTDRATTRLTIPSAKRETGTILCYIEDGELVVEVYNGNLFTDVQWRANQNWISKEDDFRFYDGVSASIKSLDINLVEVNGKIDTLQVLQITQFYPGDENYYLAVSIDNNVRTAVLSTGQNLLTFSTSTQSVNISINISSLSGIVINKYFRKEYIELVQLMNKVDSIVPSYWDDSLRISKHSLLNVDSGTYGNSGAKYGFSLKNGCSRFAVDFKINADVNTTHGDIEIAKIGDTSIKIICAAPELLKESYVNDTASYVQELKYKSGFKVGSSVHTRSARGTTPLVGDVALMVWLKGSTSSMTLENLQTREQWLENNQDYILKIENNTLSIERNGIGNNGETFNGGATSTVFSTSLLSGGDYKTVGALYNELSALDYLVVRMINTDARKTCGDLAQFGTVRMVGCYNQQLDVESSSTDYYFDSYPIPLRYKKDENWHTLEVIYVGGSAYIYIDGYKFTAETSSDVSIGSSDIALANLEVWDGIYGDDAVFNDDKSQFSSKRTPSLFAFMGHYTYDNYEGNGSQPSDSTNQTSSRLESVCSMLKKYDYKVINLVDFGNIPSQKRVSYFGNKVAMFIFDDLSFVPLYMNKVTRAHVSRYGFPMNFAVIHSRLQADTDAQDAVLPMRLNGWCCATHSLRHDVPIPRKNSINLYNELMQILDDCDKYRFVNNIFVYNWSGAWCNSYNMLKMCGYVAAIDSTGGVMHPYCNQYNLPRYNVVDNSHTLAEVEANLVK